MHRKFSYTLNVVLRYQEQYSPGAPLRGLGIVHKNNQIKVHDVSVDVGTPYRRGLEVTPVQGRRYPLAPRSTFRTYTVFSNSDSYITIILK